MTIGVTVPIPEMRDAAAPRIPSVDADRPRPLISVMVPTYEPNRYLQKTLTSVLAQDPGSGAMQIAIVDDASPVAPIEELVRQIAPHGRIEVHRHGDNLRLAGNWNRCLALSRGHYVHVLHQDDVVLPGFYKRMLAGLQSHAAPGMAFCRHIYIDEQGRRQHGSHRERWRSGVLPHWLQRITLRQLIQCPAAVVRRDVYERLGGFRSDLPYTLDWEMWVRIATLYPVWYERRVLACYRRHDENESARLAAEGRSDLDVLRAIGIFSAYLPEPQRAELTQRAYREFVRSRLKRASKLLAASRSEDMDHQLDAVRTTLGQLSPDIEVRRYSQQLIRLERQLGRS